MNERLGPEPAAVQVRDELVRLVQLLVVEGGRVASTFASLHGSHPTDVEALVHVLVAQERGTPLTPGQLGALLGLSSGAVTAVADRLERAGHLVRERDPADRRRVLLRHSAAGHRLARTFFEPLGVRTDAVMDGFTDAELDAVRRFLAGTSAAMTAHREALARPSPSS